MAFHLAQKSASAKGILSPWLAGAPSAPSALQTKSRKRRKHKTRSSKSRRQRGGASLALALQQRSGRSRRERVRFNPIGEIIQAIPTDRDSCPDLPVDLLDEACRAAATAAGNLREEIDEGLQKFGDIAGDFLNEAGKWTADAARTAVQWVAARVEDIGDVLGNAWEGVVGFAQDAWEFAGNILSAGGDMAVEFFEKLIGEFLNAMADQQKNVKSISNTKFGTLPNDLPNGGNLDLLNPVELLMKPILEGPLLGDIKDAADLISSAVGNFFSDEDMYRAIFGSLGLSAINLLEGLFNGGNIGGQEDLFNKVIKVASSYLNKHLQVIKTAVEYVAKLIANSFAELTATYQVTVEEIFQGGQSLLGGVAQISPFGDPKWNTWSIGLCGEAYKFVWFGGVCLNFPVTFTNDGPQFTVENIAAELFFGVIRAFGPSPPKVEAGAGVGFKLSAIVTNDETSLQGQAAGYGIEIDIPTSGGNPKFPDLNIGIGLTNNLGNPPAFLTIDLTLMAFWEFEPQEPPQLGGDFFIGAAYAYPFVTTENPVLGGGATGGALLQERVANGLLQSTAVHQHSRSHRRANQSASRMDSSLHRKGLGLDSAATSLTPSPSGGFENPLGLELNFNFDFAVVSEAAQEEETRRNVPESPYRSSGGSLDGNTLTKYAVFPRAGCLPGGHIYSIPECREADRLLRQFIGGKGGLQGNPGVIVGSWPSVPTGCSLQSLTNTHFNANPFSDNKRAVAPTYEFSAVCKRQYKLGPPNQHECPIGTSITTAAECWDAYYELQANFLKGPLVGQQDSQRINGLSFSPDVPNGCAVRTQAAFSANDPHFRSSPKITKPSFVASSNYRLLCKARRAWLETNGYRSCPVGSEITTAEECLEHYEMLRNAGRFKSPSTRGLVVGFFAGVPRGCSIQMNSYPGTDADMSPHFNTKRDTDGSRAVPGSAISRPGSRRGAELSEFLPICKQSSFWLTNSQKEECPQGTRITQDLTCKAAYDAVKNSLLPNKAKRVLVVSSWSNLPRGCFVNDQRSSVVENTPHLNTYQPAPSLQNGPHRALCLPGRYYLAVEGQVACPIEQTITTVAECRKAFRSLLPQLMNAAPPRSLVEFSSPNHPAWCSWQQNTEQGDGSPHFNCNVAVSLSRAWIVLGAKYQPICRIAVPEVDPIPGTLPQSPCG